MKALVLKTSEGATPPWVRIPPTPPTMAIGSQRNLRAFLFFGAMMVQLGVFRLFRENLFIMFSTIARNKFLDVFLFKSIVLK